MTQAEIRRDALPFAYNNSGYFLLGAIIEKVSGQPYAKFLEQRIFVPLGMNDTAYEGHERGAGARASGYSRAEGAYVPSMALSMTQPYAAGALVSSVDDLARWDAAISAGKLLKPASWQQAFTAYKLPGGASNNYGFGWQVAQLQGSPMLAHGGGINGFGSFALRMPTEKVFVAVLSNADSGIVQPELVASKAAAIVIGKPFPDKAMELDAKALDQFVGVYQAGTEYSRTIRRIKSKDQDQLTLQRSGGDVHRLVAHSATGFFIENMLVYLKFSKNAQGEVTHLTMIQNGSEETVPRIATPAH